MHIKPMLLLFFVLAACAGPAASPSPTPSPTPSEPLLSIESRGGRCVDGPCSTTYYLEFDGRLHEAAKPPNDVGFVEPDLVAALEQAIAEADFEEIRSRPFTGECPTAYDGQELVLEFGTPHGVERIEGCQVEIDWGSPLFQTVTTVLAPWIGV